MPKQTNTIVDSAEIVKISEGPAELLEWFKLLNALPRNYSVYRTKADEIRTTCMVDLLNDRKPEAEEPYYEKYRHMVGPHVAKRLSGMSFTEAFSFVESLYTAQSILATVEVALKNASLGMPSFRMLTLLMEPLRISKRKKIPFPIERVRTCQICRNFYWAKRSDAETCGRKPCPDVLGNQKRKPPEEGNDPINAKAGITKKRKK